jgi:hypothetical protein
MRLILSMIVLVVVGCQTPERAAPQEPQAQGAQAQEPQQPTTFTGTLHSGVVAIGGEHTGWIIAADGAAGGMEVDVSRVREDARALDGKRVTISGKVSNRNYTERGKVAVLVANSIKPAEKPAGNKASSGNGVG